MQSLPCSPRCAVHASIARTACSGVSPARVASRSCYQLRAASLLVAARSIGLRRQSLPVRPVFRVASSAAPNAASDTPSPRPPPSVGIDLGTSHSAIAVAPGGKPMLIRLLPENAARPSVSSVDSSASRAGVLLPSVVFYSSGEDGEGRQGRPLVGTAALVAAAAAGAAAAAAAASPGGSDDSSNLVRSSKRLMGRRAEESPSSPFLTIAVPSREDPLLPQQVATEIIGALLDAAQAHFGGQRPTKAVVSVPAYFSREARAATEEAARGAGLQTVRLVREPVAAALGYGLRPGAPRDETVLVVDLGGGTFDVSLLEVGGGAVEVLSTGGDASLGGDDWDAALADLIGSAFLSPAGIADWKAPPAANAPSGAPPRSPSSAARSSLLGAARAAKEALSASPAVELTLSSGASPVAARVTRAMLDQVGEPLFARAAAAIDEACFQSGVELGESVARWRESTARAEAEAAKASEGGGGGAPPAAAAAAAFKLRPKRRPPVSRVLLVGGGTRMWGFDTFIENLTGLPATKVKRVEKEEEEEEEEEGGGGGGGKGEDGNQSSALALDVVDPDTSVAAGAALQAAMLDGDPALSGVVVLDVWQAGLARALAEARLAAEEKKAANGGGAGGDESDDDDDDGFFGGGDDQGELLEDGNRLVFSPPPPPPSKTKLRKQRARAAKRSGSAGGAEQKL